MWLVERLVSLQYIYRVIPLLTLLSTPRLHGQERSWVLFITKNLIFSQRGNDFAYVTLLSGMLLELRIWSSEANFCHWSNAFWLNAICPPPFSPARARFWKRDCWPEFFWFAPRCWCDDSQGAAHRRFYSDQKYIKKQLYFNNFRLQHIVGNIICILVAGFSFILGMTVFLMNLRRSIFHCFLHVQILLCFA